jgi:hypothetical protein
VRVFAVEEEEAMSKLFFELMERLTPTLARGDLEVCERELAAEIKKLPVGPFHIVLDLSITNDPADAARYFDRFFASESKRFQIGAAYTEMNGFDINTDRWYCDLFAYQIDGGGDEYDWLSDWQSTQFADYTICGLERLQQVYASEALGGDDAYLCSLMVVVKFQSFMQRAATQMELLQFPLYVTAHDFDFIASFDPRPEEVRQSIRKPSQEEQIRELILKLRDEASRVRFYAASKLSEFGPEANAAVPLLLQLVDDPLTATRQAAVTALATIAPASDAVVSAFVAALKGDHPSYVKQEIVRALGSSPTHAAVAALANALRDHDEGVRRRAVISLKCLGASAKEAAPVLEKLLETETNSEIRSQASTALNLIRLSGRGEV